MSLPLGVSTFRFLHQGVSIFWSASDTDLKNLSPNFSRCGDVSTLAENTFCSFSRCLHLLISKWHWLQKPKFQLSGGVVSTCWSASDTDFKNLSFGCLCLSIRVFSIFWSASDTDFKNLSSNFHWRGLSPPFDQQVILTSKTYVWVSPPFDQVTMTQKPKPNLWVSPFDPFLISKWHWLQKPKFQLSLGGCLHLLISKWHWLQKPKFWVSLPFNQGVSIFWSASDTDFKNLSSNFHWRGLSPPFDQQVILTSKTYVWVSPPFDHGVSAFWSASDIDFKNISSNFQVGVVSTFWSASVTDFKNLSSNLHWGVVSTFWSASDTDIKNLSLGVSTFWSGCLWPLNLSPTFDHGVSAFWSASDIDFKNLSSNFQLGVVSTFWSASDTDFKNLSSNFHWGVVSTFWSASDTDFKNLSLGVSAFWSGCLYL